MTLVAYKKVCNRDSINYLLANLIEQIRHIKLFAPSLNITREKIYIYFLFTSLYSVSKTDLEISMMGVFFAKNRDLHPTFEIYFKCLQTNLLIWCLS